MFVVQGTPITRPLTAKLLVNESCPNCKAHGTLEVVLFQRYMSIGIPIFPMGYPVGMSCTSCGSEIVDPDKFLRTYRKTLPESLMQEARAIKKFKRSWRQKLFPWSSWLCFLAFIVVALIVTRYQQYDAKQAARETAELLAHPQVGDIYKSHVSVPSNSESVSRLVKVVRIDGNTMYVTIGKKTLSGRSSSDSNWSGLSRAPDAFGSVEYPIDLRQFLRGRGSFFVQTEHPESIGGVASWDGLHPVERTASKP